MDFILVLHWTSSDLILLSGFKPKTNELADISQLTYVKTIIRLLIIYIQICE